MLKNKVLEMLKKKQRNELMTKHQQALHIPRFQKSSSSSNSGTPAGSSPSRGYGGSAPKSRPWAHLRQRTVHHVQPRQVHRMLTPKQIRHINHQNGMER